MDREIQLIAERCSKFQEINASELPLLRPYVENFLDKDWLDAKLEEYEVWAQSNSDPFLQHRFLHRPTGFNMLVSAIWAAHYWEREREKDASFEPRMGAIRLMNIATSLAVLELHAEQWLDCASRRYLRQRLQSTADLWGIIHELNTFAFFTRQGAIVEPEFLKRANRREITVNWHRSVIPVQCKNLRPGTGRSISQELFINLASYIVLDMRKTKKRLIIKIGTTGKISEDDIDFLRSQAKRYAGKTVAPLIVERNNRGYSITSQRLSTQFALNLLEESYLRMIISEPEAGSGEYRPVAIVTVESNAIEKPLNSLESAIMKGIKQLPGDKSGILAIYYTDPVNDFDVLCPAPQTMQLYISKLLDPFPHVGAVILSSEPDYLGPPGGKAGKTRVYYRKPWSFPEDFLQHNT